MEDHHKSGERRNLKGRFCDIGAAFRGRVDVPVCWRCGETPGGGGERAVGGGREGTRE